MSKRSLEESRGAQEPDNNGLVPIHDLLSPGEEQPGQPSGPSKKPRNFIATVACENCRVKKTRCDESRPRCGLCKSLGLECVYNERKSSKRDQSLTMIMSTLHRLETKLESMPTSIVKDLQSLRRAVDGPQQPQTQPSPAVGVGGSALTSMPTSAGETLTPGAQVHDHDDFDFEENQTATDSADRVSISFSQHGVILWPGARRILPEQLLATHEMLGKNYVIELESTRPPLPMFTGSFPLQAGDHWLEALPLAMIKGLADAFFSVFNPFTPIMDKAFFFSFTLGSAIESGFGYTVESCLVLNVLALGCLAVLAHQEGNYPLPGTQSHRFEPPEWMNVVFGEQPGLRFFNEARRRIGFLMCDNDIQSCQFYLLSSVYYNQILRPMDSWAMIHRAATCCLSMLTNHDVNFDEWEGDMKSRVYWNCLMNETILVQELHLPPSGLSRLEERVPIPKFISFETTGYVSTPFASSSVVDDSYFQYHFLAQVAHRIILTRIRHSLYFYSDSGTFPLPAVNAELHHQLEQWRTNLPPTIQFSISSSPLPSNSHTTPAEQSGSSIHPSPSPAATTTLPNNPISPRPTDSTNRPLSPATAITDAMLRGRYQIARFHIGRPYLYKALRIPGSLTDEDFEQIKSGLLNAMDWPVTQGIFRKMKSCIPIKFAFCSQFFGQILLFYCIAHSPTLRLRETLPSGWERWNEEMLRFLEECAPHSPAVTQDLGLLRSLWPESESEPE
ncbi:transcriptional regulator family: Fungal Specific TF [Penicillium alfredii]|uniref:Transcriptional regulator family: Fungal Specific TF n=1 Tax=Penicillium alfredii TaxID=1506179 RepID=A0A9W9FR31_9EURO|nr:transcriptional regulator family: Fungal Specific TF [Penicillium alfredii]KAJ5104512.1 transcriptional regulator family: Fungal Specific TF [Penicillium alfredii]